MNEVTAAQLTETGKTGLQGPDVAQSLLDDVAVSKTTRNGSQQGQFAVKIN